MTSCVGVSTTHDDRRRDEESGTRDGDSETHTNDPRDDETDESHSFGMEGYAGPGQPAP